MPPDEPTNPGSIAAEVSSLRKAQIKTSERIGKIEVSTSATAASLKDIECHTRKTYDTLHGSRGLVERVTAVEGPVRSLNGRVAAVEKVTQNGRVAVAVDHTRAAMWYRVLGVIGLLVAGAAVTGIAQALLG
jgi:hypothetical protein